MTDVESITGSAMGPGTLYGALARLERRGLIEALEPVERRRPYRLTGLGETTVRAQLERLAGFTADRTRTAAGARRHDRAHAALPADLARRATRPSSWTSWRLDRLAGRPAGHPARGRRCPPRSAGAGRVGRGGSCRAPRDRTVAARRAGGGHRRGAWVAVAPGLLLAPFGRTGPGTARPASSSASVASTRPGRRDDRASPAGSLAIAALTVRALDSAAMVVGTPSWSSAVADRRPRPVLSVRRQRDRRARC